MPKKPKKNQTAGVRRPVRRRKSLMSGALTWFSFGCLAECYLLIVRRYYVDGSPTQLIAAYAVLKYLMIAGAAALALGVLLAAAFRKKNAARKAGVLLAAAGAFLVLANLIMRLVYPTGTTLLCVVVPAAAVMSLLWCVYDRECSLSLTVLALSVVALWICRRGVASEYWSVKVRVGAAVYLAVLAVLALVFFRADRNGGKLGRVQLLPPDADCLPLYVACGASAAALIPALFSVTVAYYAMWAVAVLMFALAVYYTVRLL